MNENYIVINGKKIELTEEQLKQLGIASEKKRKNPFDRVPIGKDHFSIGRFDDSCALTEFDTVIDRKLNAGANYFNDEAFAKQVALRQLLYRKLLKFAYDNECEDTAKWNKNIQHWLIVYNTVSQRFEVAVDLTLKEAVVYFSTKEATERAIKEVVEPFMKEHPEFVW